MEVQEHHPGSLILEVPSLSQSKSDSYFLLSSSIIFLFSLSFPSSTLTKEDLSIHGKLILHQLSTS